ncbi:MAG: hypothetical protein JF587_05815 [Catenulisporales bacterium]|jgi:hypothetical protein|nr:hypothetical protein [Catenulisporales bacterium]
MRSFRTAVAAAGAALLICGLTAGNAHADVGVVVVQHMAPDGSVLCTHDYLAANLLAPHTFTDRGCEGATSMRITNDTLEPITVTPDAQTATASSQILPSSYEFMEGLTVMIRELGGL